ncbi:MAG: recombinase family protein [Clostridiales bacterium]|nr:recombinase family protein [Clostridiales bacterium]
MENEPTEKTIVALYTRVSTQEQASDGYSIDEQKERLTKYAEAHDWKIYNTYVDPGFSGGSMERPGLKDLIIDVTAGKIEKVIVYKLDRLSRSQKDTLYLIEDVFLVNGVDFVSMTENFDTGTPLGRAMIGILSVFAQLEREQIKERMTLGKVGRVKSGLWTGSAYHIPTGYKYIDGKLEVDPYYADVVRRIFREFNNGRTLVAISNDLKSDGIKTTKGYYFGTATIRSILKHETYIGVVSYGAEKFPGNHQPIIDNETFEKAQQRLEYRRQNDERYLHFSHRAHLITGLCYCPYCNTKKEIQYRSKKYNNGEDRAVVVCHEKKKNHCPVPRLSVNEIEEAVLTEIRKLRIDPEYFKKCRSSTYDAGNRDRIKTLTDHIAENERKIKRLTDLYMLEEMDFSDLKDRIDDLTTEIKSNRREIARLKENVHVVLPDEEILSLVDMLDQESGDLEKMKIIVDKLIKRIDIDTETITIHWNF